MYCNTITLRFDGGVGEGLEVDELSDRMEVISISSGGQLRVFKLKFFLIAGDLHSEQIFKITSITVSSYRLFLKFAVIIALLF